MVIYRLLHQILYVLIEFINILLIMIAEKVRLTLEVVANKILPVLIPLQQTQALVVKGEQKLDRIDIKILKEADKLSNKEYRAEVKLEGDRHSKRKGSITYRSYSIEFKKKLIASIREQIRGNGTSLSRIIREKARELKIHPKNITRWYHTKELKKKEGGRKALYPEMEVRLANFILNNPSMRRKHILKQAKQIMQELNIPGREEFNFSKGWYERFRERLNKSKILAEIKQEDCIKYEVKLEHLNYNDEVKQEEDQLNEFTDEESFASEDDSYDYEEEVKLEEQLSDDEQDNNKASKSCSKMAKKSFASKKEISLFFDQDQGGDGAGSESLMNLIQEQQEMVHEMLAVIK